jgi:hypothetical protein
LPDQLVSVVRQPSASLSLAEVQRVWKSGGDFGAFQMLV